MIATTFVCDGWTGEGPCRHELTIGLPQMGAALEAAAAGWNVSVATGKAVCPHQHLDPAVRLPPAGDEWRVGR